MTQNTATTLDSRTLFNALSDERREARAAADATATVAVTLTKKGGIDHASIGAALAARAAEGDAALASILDAVSERARAGLDASADATIPALRSVAAEVHATKTSRAATAAEGSRQTAAAATRSARAALRSAWVAVRPVAPRALPSGE